MNVLNRETLVSHRFVAVFTILLTMLLTVQESSASPPGRLLFHASSTSSSLATLANREITRSVDHSGTQTLHIAPDTDAYVKVAWEFRLSAPPFPGSDRLVLEVEYFDDGAGVIQPTLLANDDFKGTYAVPLRSVSFTRLNQQRVRHALFEFDNPRLPTDNTVHPHLRIAGLQGLIALRAYPAADEARWQAVAEAVPRLVDPMLTLRRPMKITCTIGIPDVGDPPSLETALDNIREYGPLARLMGFTSAECFVRWNLIETQPGQFDFTHYDTIVAAIRERGLKWYPNLVITSAFALPTWYLDSAENVGFRCLEHGEENAVPTIWNAANLRHVKRVLKAFGDHYEPTGILEAVRLGPSGNFGEAQFPAGAGGGLGVRGQRMHAHIGWWAGDAYARKDFQDYLRSRYGSTEALNAAWDEDFTSGVVYGLHDTLV